MGGGSPNASWPSPIPTIRYPQVQHSREKRDTSLDLRRFEHSAEISKKADEAKGDLDVGFGELNAKEMYPAVHFPGGGCYRSLRSPTEEDAESDGRVTYTPPHRPSEGRYKQPSIISHTGIGGGYASRIGVQGWSTSIVDRSKTADPFSDSLRRQVDPQCTPWHRRDRDDVFGAQPPGNQGAASTSWHRSGMVVPRGWRVTRGSSATIRSYDFPDNAQRPWGGNRSDHNALSPMSPFKRPPTSFETVGSTLGMDGEDLTGEVERAAWGNASPNKIVQTDDKSLFIPGSGTQHFCSTLMAPMRHLNTWKPPPPITYSEAKERAYQKRNGSCIRYLSGKEDGVRVQSQIREAISTFKF